MKFKIYFINLEIIGEEKLCVFLKSKKFLQYDKVSWHNHDV